MSAEPQPVATPHYTAQFSHRRQLLLLEEATTVLSDQTLVASSSKSSPDLNSYACSLSQFGQ